MGMSPVLVTWHLESKAPERIPVLAQGCDAAVRYPGDVIEIIYGAKLTTTARRTLMSSPVKEWNLKIAEKADRRRWGRGQAKCRS